MTPVLFRIASEVIRPDRFHSQLDQKPGRRDLGCTATTSGKVREGFSRAHRIAHRPALPKALAERF